MSIQSIQTLTKIKLDVVETIRKVVDVISKYAGNSLPENAQRFVRQSILSLPGRWANAVQVQNRIGSANGVEGSAGSRELELPTKTSTEEVAGRILTFAIEGLDMLKAVTSIFGESVERA
jgi:transcriptional repressor OPI1